MRTLTILLAVFAIAVARPQILDDVPSTTPQVPNVKTSGSADLEDRSLIDVPSSNLPFFPNSYYPFNIGKNSQSAIYAAPSSLPISSAGISFPFGTPVLCFLSDTGVPTTYPPLSSVVTSPQYGFPMINPVTGLQTVFVSPDNGGSFGNVMNAAQEAVMVNRSSIYVFAPEYLSLNDVREAPASNTASNTAKVGVDASTAAATEAAADAVESVSRESNAEARPVSLPLGQPADSLASRIALRNAAAPFSLYPNIMYFGGVPVGARIQQDAAANSPSPNVIYFGGVPVRVLGAP
ncbi:uncharacterized protein LOC126252701 [Schistocerca nitens]|uniref:uncharacterized protein LOC126252701 n=1 Tax=Schistocerca nitens TaxID=7011 RepID=UPI002118832C|nr:uncharacterized protein LOC126252701 [Schistocerca nitens]